MSISSIRSRCPNSLERSVLCAAAIALACFQQGPAGEGDVALLQDGNDSPAIPEEYSDLNPRIFQKLHALVDRSSSPRRLPTESQETAYQRLRDREKSWNREQLVEAYKKHGRRNPQWDEPVIKLLTQIAETFPGDPRAAVLWHRWKTAENIVTELGCDDPLVRYFYARWLIHHGRRRIIPELRREGRRQLLIVLKDFPQTKYSRAIQSFATLFAVKIRVNEITYSSIGRNPSVKPHALGKEFWKAFNREFDRALKDPAYRKAGLPLLLDHLTFHLKHDEADWEHWKAFVDRVLAVDSIDLWLANMLAAEYEIAAAWEARGNQLANRVKPEGWEGFHSHLLKARKHLLEAWYLHPEYPHAATKMIQVTGGAGRIVGDSIRFWFDQAVAARLDHMKAYGYLINFLQPQWRGSEQAMIDFGLECLNTKRFDTDVPAVYSRVIDKIVARGGASDTIYQKEGTYQSLREMYEGYIEQAEDEKLKEILESELLARAWQARKPEEAKRLLARLGNDVDQDVLLLFSTNRRDIQLWLKKIDLGPDAEPFTGHQGQISKIAYSPDGKILASAGVEDMVVRLWDAKTGRDIGTLEDYKERLWALAFAPDGTKLAAGGWQRGIFIWDVASRRQLQVLPVPGLIRCLSFSPDGRTIAVSTGSTNSNTPGILQFWDLNSRQELGDVPQQDSAIVDMAFSPDGKHLATTSIAYYDLDRKPQAGEVKVFEVASRQEIRKATPLNRYALSITYSADGKKLVIGGYRSVPRIGVQSQILILNAETLEADKTIDAREQMLRSLSLSPDGQQIASGGDSRVVSLWSADGKMLKSLYWHQEKVSNVVISPDGFQLASADYAGGLRTWDLNELEEDSRAAIIDANLSSYRHPRALLHMAFSPDGKLLALGGLTSAVSVWNAENGNDMSAFRVDGPRLSFLSFSNDNTRLATAHAAPEGGRITVWDLKTMKGRGFTKKIGTSPQELIWLPGDKSILSVHSNRNIIWDVKTGRMLNLARHQLKYISSAAISNDGKVLAIGDRRGSIALMEIPDDMLAGENLDTKTLSTKATIKGTGQRISNLRFSPDGKTLASGDRDKGVLLWDIESREQRLALEGMAVAFSPNGERIATGGGSKIPLEARIYDAATGELLLTLKGGHQKMVMSVRFSTDGKRLITGGQDGTVRFWDAQTGEPLN